MKFNEDDKVIVKSNEDEKFKIGHFVGYYGLDNCPDPIPMVKFDDEDEALNCF